MANVDPNGNASFELAKGQKNVGLQEYVHWSSRKLKLPENCPETSLKLPRNGKWQPFRLQRAKNAAASAAAAAVAAVWLLLLV